MRVPDARQRPRRAARARHPRRSAAGRLVPRRSRSSGRAAGLRHRGDDHRRHRALRGRTPRGGGVTAVGPGSQRGRTTRPSPRLDSPKPSRRAARSRPPELGPQLAVGPSLQPTLAELSRPGRGTTKVPHPPADALARIPGGPASGGQPLGLPELNEPEVIRHFVNLSQLNFSRRHRVLPARLVHHEVQPQDQRVGRAAAGLRGAAPARARRRCAGHPRAHVGAGAVARRDQRHERRHAAAGRRRARRADRAS